MEYSNGKHQQQQTAVSALDVVSLCLAKIGGSDDSRFFETFPNGAGLRDAFHSINTPSGVTYAAIIVAAIKSTETCRMVLSEIYEFVASYITLVPSAALDESGIQWRNSVRHNLSVRKCFKKVPREDSEGKKQSSYWTIDESILPTAAHEMRVYVDATRELLRGSIVAATAAASAQASYGGMQEEASMKAEQFAVQLDFHQQQDGDASMDTSQDEAGLYGDSSILDDDEGEEDEITPTQTPLPSQMEALPISYSMDSGSTTLDSENLNNALQSLIGGARGSFGESSRHPWPYQQQQQHQHQYQQQQQQQQYPSIFSRAASREQHQDLIMQEQQQLQQQQQQHKLSTARSMSSSSLFGSMPAESSLSSQSEVDSTWNYSYLPDDGLLLDLSFRPDPYIQFSSRGSSRCQSRCQSPINVPTGDLVGY